MRHSTRQSGFSPIEIIVVLAVIGLIGVVAYTAYNRIQNNKTTESSQAGTQSPTAGDVKTAPAINTTTDLDKAQAVLDQTDPGGSNAADASQMDTELAAF